MLKSLTMVRAASDARGVALVEFALCLPLLIVMYMGGYVVTDMVSCNRKVTVATRALVDLASHNLSPFAVQQSPASTSAASYLSAAAVILTPYNLGNATQAVAMLRVCDATHAYLVWSQTMTQTGNGTVLTSPTTVGTPAATSVFVIPATMVTQPAVPVNPDGSAGICSNYAPSNSNRTQVGQAGGYLFEGEVKYYYTPPIGLGVKTGTMMGDTIYMSPRLY